MRRQLLVLIALAAVLIVTSVTPAHANNGRGGHGGGRGFGRGGFGGGCGTGGFGLGVGGYGGGCGWDIAELYNQLYNNLPYFALHPPVYYSDVVPRTYGYSPFAYPPGVMTPDLTCAVQPVTISNPYVPATKPGAPASTENVDRAAAVERAPEPLVIMNPYCPASTVAQTEK